MSIEAMKQALEALEKLWDIIDDIDTYGDMAKSDDKLYRSLVERRQRQRFEQTGICTDGYELNGGAITSLRQAIAEAEKQEPVARLTYVEDSELYTVRFFKEKPPSGSLLYTHPQPAQPKEPLTDAATVAGLHASIGHLSALVDHQYALLQEVNNVCGRDGHGGELEDGESDLIDRVRQHLKTIVAQPKREPLTDEQAMDAYCETPPFGTYKEAFIAGIRFIEAAHGIKGEA